MTGARIQCVHPRRGWPEWCAHLVMRAKESLPFAESANGQYTHRVRYVELHLPEGQGKSHFVASCWCGQSVAERRKTPGRLVEVPTRVVCATCEGRAIGSGQLGSRVLAGREVMFRPHSSAESAV